MIRLDDRQQTVTLSPTHPEKKNVEQIIILAKLPDQLVVLAVIPLLSESEGLIYPHRSPSPCHQHTTYVDFKIT